MRNGLVIKKAGGASPLLITYVEMWISYSVLRPQNGCGNVDKLNFVRPRLLYINNEHQNFNKIFVLIKKKRLPARENPCRRSFLEE